MRMTKLMIILAVLSLALMGLNCKDDESPEEAIPDKFVGTWEADSTIEGTLIEITPVGDIRVIGAEVRAVINKDGTYSLTMNLILIPGETDQGKVTIEENLNIISFISNDPESDPVIFAYGWEGDILVLTTQADLGLGDLPSDVTIKLIKSS